MEYEALLERLYKNIPSQSIHRERFEMPVIDSFIQGTKTLIKNYAQILKSINRDGKDLAKFLNKESAAPATLEGDRLVLSGKFSQIQLQGWLSRYLDEYVLCKQCRRPDTKEQVQEGIHTLKCEACGAVFPIKKV